MGVYLLLILLTTHFPAVKALFRCRLGTSAVPMAAATTSTTSSVPVSAGQPCPAAVTRRDEPSLPNSARCRVCWKEGLYPVIFVFLGEELGFFLGGGGAQPTLGVSVALPAAPARETGA